MKVVSDFVVSAPVLPEPVMTPFTISYLKLSPLSDDVVLIVETMLTPVTRALELLMFVVGPVTTISNVVISGLKLRLTGSSVGSVAVSATILAFFISGFATTSVSYPLVVVTVHFWLRLMEKVAIPFSSTLAVLPG